jgi:hypothetical protein
VTLPDLVDGMDLTKKWGVQYLQLVGGIDVAWIVRMNDKIRASVPETEDSCFLERGSSPYSEKKI